MDNSQVKMCHKCSRYIHKVLFIKCLVNTFDIILLKQSSIEIHMSVGYHDSAWASNVYNLLAQLDIQIR